jgi:hypothetical protein
LFSIIYFFLLVLAANRVTEVAVTGTVVPVEAVAAVLGKMIDSLVVVIGLLD